MEEKRVTVRSNDDRRKSSPHGSVPAADSARSNRGREDESPRTSKINNTERGGGGNKQKDGRRTCSYLETEVG